MARRRSYRRRSYRRSFTRRSHPMTLPIAPIAGLAVGLAGPAQALMNGNITQAAQIAALNYTGFDPSSGKWVPTAMMGGLVPLIIGGLVHKFVGGRPVGINAMLAKAGVPIIRI